MDLSNFQINDFNSSLGFFHFVSYNKSKSSFEQVELIIIDDKVLKRTYDSYFSLIRSEDTLYSPSSYLPSLIEEIKKSENIVSGVSASVYRDSYLAEHDCTNGGVSSMYNRLYLVSEEGKGNSTPKFLIECLLFERRKFSFGFSNRAIPIIQAGTHFAFGGNFLYSSDGSFSTIAGESVPLKILDRAM